MKDSELDLEIIGNLIIKIIINQGSSWGGHSNEYLVFKFLGQGERVENGCLTWPVLPKIIHKNQNSVKLFWFWFWDEVNEKIENCNPELKCYFLNQVSLSPADHFIRELEKLFERFFLFLRKSIQRFRRKNRKTGGLDYTFRGSIWYGIGSRTSLLHNN